MHQWRMNMKVFIRLLIVVVIVGFGSSVYAGENLNWQLIRAIEGHDVQEVKILVKKGADVNAKAYDGRTALMKACKIKSLPMCKVLVEKGAHVNAKDNTGKTPLMFALWGSKWRSKEKCNAVYDYLVSKGADVKAKDSGGYTAAMLAAIKVYSVNHTVNGKICKSASADTHVQPIEDALNKYDVFLAEDYPRFNCWGNTLFEYMLLRGKFSLKQKIVKYFLEDILSYEHDGSNYFVTAVNTINKLTENTFLDFLESQRDVFLDDDNITKLYDELIKIVRDNGGKRFSELK